MQLSYQFTLGSISQKDGQVNYKYSFNQIAAFILIYHMNATLVIYNTILSRNRAWNIRLFGLWKLFSLICSEADNSDLILLLGGCKSFRRSKSQRMVRWSKPWIMVKTVITLVITVDNCWINWITGKAIKSRFLNFRALKIFFYQRAQIIL